MINFKKRKFLVIFIISTLFLPSIFSACGKRGVPLPPSLVVPKKISDLRLLVSPGKRMLSWTIPKVNADGTKPVDLISFKIRLKQVAEELDSCRYCEEGFTDYTTINLLNPQLGYQQGDSFYLPLPDIRDQYVYVFSVISLNSRGWSSENSNKLAIFSLPQIAPPNQLKLIPSASMVELNWVAPTLPDNFTGKLGFNVYRRQLNTQIKLDATLSKWQLITPELVNQPTYIDVGLHDWQSYDYAVTAVVTSQTTSKESTFSNISHIKPGDYTSPSAPENFSAFYYQAGIQLIWNPSQASDVAGYNVYRRDDISGVDNIIAVLNSSQFEYFDFNFTPGRIYYYRVTAFDSSDRKNESSSSPEIVVRTH